MASESYYGDPGKILENRLKIMHLRAIFFNKNVQLFCKTRVILGGGAGGKHYWKTLQQLCILESLFVIKTKHFCL